MAHIDVNSDPHIRSPDLPEAAALALREHFGSDVSAAVLESLVPPEDAGESMIGLDRGVDVVVSVPVLLSVLRDALQRRLQYPIARGEVLQLRAGRDEAA